MGAITLDEYTRHDALGLAELVRRNEVQPEELLDVAIAAIEQTNPRLNAVITRLYDRARDRIAAGLPTGPFTGVPYLLKDMLDLEGTKVTWGSRLLRNNVSTHTHEILRRMEATGLSFLGRTNMSELGMVPHAEPKAYGPTRNPWDLDRSPGGSSGGAAAAVAAGVVPMAHAADGGGSIRIPASACGLFGLKPSKGRNPVDLDEPTDEFVNQHVISRTVRDSAAMLDAIQGARSFERLQLPAPSRPYLEIAAEPPGTLKIGYTLSDFFGNPVHPDCREAVLATAGLLTELGHEIEESAPVIDAESYFHGFQVLWCASAGFFYEEVRRELGKQERIPAPLRLALGQRQVLKLLTSLPTNLSGNSMIEPFTRKLAALDRKHTPADLMRAWIEMRRAEAELRNFLSGFDMLLTPVMAEPPWPIGYLKQNWSIRRLQEELLRYVAFTPIANSTGFPAMSVPLHWSPQGLPIGSHFIAPLGAEDRLFQLATQLEAARPWRDRRPPAFI